jgi:hypothetical protein
VAVDFSAIVSLSVSVSFRYRLFGVEVSSVSSSQGLEVSVYRGVRVSLYQSIGVRCKDTGAVVGETTLLLDFETLRLNV